MSSQATPLLLILPTGAHALVAGSRPARYVGWQGSVEIPEDLVRAGFFWHGSWLTDGTAVLFSGDYGIPGIFDAARRARQPAITQLTFFDLAA